MKKPFLIIAAAILTGMVPAPAAGNSGIGQVPFSQVRIDDPFWTPRLDIHKNVTLNVCIDQIENRTGRLRNFENAALGAGTHSGIFYDDSDVYKALEGMAYSLKNNPDPELEARCDRWIAAFAAAQRPDGYINTYYTLTGLENRWTDMNYHEMYCAGHLIEAAVAYLDATGKPELLGVARRMADHMMSEFGPGRRDWISGHEEIELALVKLYGATGERKYLDFADWLLSERGRADFLTDCGWSSPDYAQYDVPVSEITDIKGHAVRAMYLYCGMADVAALTGNRAYIDALERVWEDVVGRNMYITGGIGSSGSNEGFTADYDLPNREAYCETCASVGMVLWNARMNRLSGDAKYMDVCERVIYNALLSGISRGGELFFYDNPLESYGDKKRSPWFGTACCPSNLCRFIPSIGNYIYCSSEDALWVNMFIGNEAVIDGMAVKMSAGMPFDGSVELLLSPERRIRRQIRIRIPGWCGDKWSLSVNGRAVKLRMDRGYAVLERSWRKGDRISLNFDMTPRAVCADPRVKADEGKLALMRGPLVYCIEEIDNGGSYDSAAIDGTTRFTVGDGGRTISSDSLKFIPYYDWCNRVPCRMKVWIDENH